MVFFHLSTQYTYSLYTSAVFITMILWLDTLEFYSLANVSHCYCLVCRISVDSIIFCLIIFLSKGNYAQNLLSSIGELLSIFLICQYFPCDHLRLPWTHEGTYSPCNPSSSLALWEKYCQKYCDTNHRIVEPIISIQIYRDLALAFVIHTIFYRLST